MARPLALALETEKRITAANPYDGSVRTLTEAKGRILKQRWAAIGNAKQAKTFGIVVSTKAGQMRFNLDLACKSFGIVSSKSDGMDGRAVETLYRAGRYEDIALYCLEDVRATSELYLKLESTLLM
ncbi:MAG: diphthamide synthesis protein, partial [Thermoplasmatota archaeon]